MSDFDITAAHKSTYFKSMKTRKALGLFSDSEDDDELPLHKTKKQKKKEKSGEGRSETDNERGSKDPEDEQQRKQEEEAKPARNPYLLDSPDLDFMQIMDEPLRKLPPPPPTLSKEATYSTSSLSSVGESSNRTSSLPDADLDGLDPDLAALLQSTPSEPTSQEAPQKVVVKVRYTYYSKKEIKEGARKVIERLSKPVKFIVLDNTQFRVILTNFCKNKKLRVQDMLLTYNDEVVFLSATPLGVGMGSVGTYLMKAYPKACYEEMQKDKEEMKLERMKALTEVVDEEEETMDEFKTEAPAQSTSPPVEEGIRLKLRGSDNKDVPFRAKPTTTLQQLVDAYKQRTNISSDIKLSFEGEVLDLNQAIQDTDLEDEDLVEVIQ